MNKITRRSLTIGGCAIGLVLGWKGVRYARTRRLAKSLGAFSFPPIDGLQNAHGAPAPGFASSDLIGQTSLVIAFASWCPYCQAQHATLMDFARQSRTRIYGVDCNDTPKNCLRYLHTKGNPFCAVGFDPAGEFLSLAQARGVPCTLVVGQELHVLWGQSEGELSIADLEHVLAKTTPEVIQLN